jgi:hypothetical protein
MLARRSQVVALSITGPDNGWQENAIALGYGILRIGIYVKTVAG